MELSIVKADAAQFGVKTRTIGDAGKGACIEIACTVCHEGAQDGSFFCLPGWLDVCDHELDTAETTETVLSHMKGKIVAMAFGEWIISPTKGDGWDGLAVFILELQPQMVAFLSDALTRKTPLMLESKEGLGIFLAARFEQAQSLFELFCGVL